MPLCGAAGFSGCPGLFSFAGKKYETFCLAAHGRYDGGRQYFLPENYLRMPVS